MEENKIENNAEKSGLGKAVGLIILIAVAIAGFYFLNSDGVQIADLTQKEVVVAEDGSVKGSYAIKDIMALEKPLQCTFNINREDASVNGSVIIYGKDVRGDFDISGTPVGNIASHFILKDDVSYTWTSLANVGYKKGITEEAGTSASPEDQASIVGINDDVDYSCVPWNPNLTVFNLPSGIIFSEIE